MDLLNIGSDPWIMEYDSCEKLAREIMEHLNSRDSEKSSQAYDALSGKIRIKLKQFSTEVSELNRKLNLASVVSTLTPEERERRQRQVENLQSKEHQLKDCFGQRKRSDDSNLLYSKTRAELFEKKGRDPVFADMGTTSWGETRGSDTEYCKTVADMKEEQQRLLQEQNEGLESLLKIVTGQKQIATSINDEVEHHNEILVEIADGMERVDNRMNRATDMVSVISRKESIWGNANLSVGKLSGRARSFEGFSPGSQLLKLRPPSESIKFFVSGYWLVAFLLFIAILGVAFA